MKQHGMVVLVSALAAGLFGSRPAAQPAAQTAAQSSAAPSTRTSPRQKQQPGRITSVCLTPPARQPRFDWARGLNPPSSRAGRRASGRAGSRSLPLVCRTGEGLRQSVLRRREGVLLLGRRHLGRHHRHRRDLRLLGRRGSRRRVEEAGARPGDDQVPDHQSRPRGSLRRGEVPAGSLPPARDPFCGGLGSARSHDDGARASRSATWSRPTA